MTEKRNIDDNLFCTTIILIDLEGVCIPNNFEEEKIFPFVRQHIEEYIDKNWADKSFQGQVQILREQIKLQEEKKLEGFVAIPEGENEDTRKALLKNLFWQLDSKNITEGFKKIQKEICELGYTSGNLKVQLCDKIDTSIRTWSADGKKVFILSSYNVDEQKILLTNTEKGDLIEVIVGYFDEKVGPKNEKETYAKILEKLECPANDVMFICNKSESALAASASGLVTLLISKDDTTRQGTNIGVTVINSISDIEFEATTKKRKISNESEVVPVLHSGEDLCKNNISNESDVEMMDISENEITENTLKKIEKGLDDFNREESKSNEVSNSIELGDGDWIKMDNNEISAKPQTKIDGNEVKAIDIEIELLNGITDVSKEDLKLDETKDENKKSAVEEKVVTSSNLQSTSVASNKLLDDESAHKTELEPMTEDKKTDKKVDILDREVKNMDVDVSIKAERSSEEIENENENSLVDQHPASEKGEIEVDKLSVNIEPDTSSIDNSAVNTKTEISAIEEDKNCLECNNDIGKLEVEEKQKINIPSEPNTISIDNDKSEVKDKQIDGQCSSSKNNTSNKDVCSENPKSDKVSEDNIVDSFQSPESNRVSVANVTVKKNVGDKDINTDKVEMDNIVDNSQSTQSNTASVDNDIAKPENDDKTSLSSEINTVNIDANIATQKVSENKNTESDTVSVGNDIAQHEIGEDQSLSSENNTINIDVDAEAIEPIKHLEDKSVNTSQSLEPNTINIEDSDKQINKQCSSEDNIPDMDVDAATIKPDKPSEEENVDSSQSPESNPINLDKDIAKPEDRGKQEDKTCSSSEIVSTSMDVDGTSIESDKTSEALHVDSFQSPESNTVNFDKDSVKPKDGGKQIVETCSSSEITSSMDIDTATIKQDKPLEDKNIDHSQLPESNPENFDIATTKPEVLDEQCSTSETNTTKMDIDAATVEPEKPSEDKTVDKFQSPEAKILSINNDNAQHDVLDKLGCSMDVDTATVESDKMSVEMNAEKEQSPESNYDMTKPKVLIDQQCSSSGNNTKNMDFDTANIDKEKSVEDIMTSSQDSNSLIKNVEVDKPSVEKKVDEPGQISLNVLTGNGESKDNNTDLKNETYPVVISETTNDQNKVAESQELAGISEATKKSINNEIRSNHEEEKTDVTESLNGTTANEKTQNGIIGSGNEEKYIDGDNKITNGENLPSSENKQVVENSLTTGTEIEA